MAEKKKSLKEPAPNGRPSTFNEKISDIIINLAKQGKTDSQIADILGVNERTINNWKVSKPEFYQSLKEAKKAADELVEASLFQRAVGYSHPAVKICAYEGHSWEHKYKENYPPDTTAAIFWLKNRQPDQWREKRELEIDQVSVNQNNNRLDPESEKILLDHAKSLEDFAKKFKK